MQLASTEKSERVIKHFTECTLDKEVRKTVKEKRNILHTVKSSKANCTGDILRRNSLLKHIIQGQRKKDMWRENKKEDVSSYCTLRKLEDTENWKRKNYIALRGEITVDEAMDMS
jgi:hypothetical protein